MFSIFKGITLSQDELDQYYIKKRKQYYEKHGAIPKHIRLHNMLHWILVPCIMLLRKINGIKLTMVCDERIKTDKPIIYACTHIGGVDIAIRSEAQIVPVALECYGKRMYVAIGKNIEVAGIWQDKYALTNYLRDELATLKWRIFEEVGVCSRIKNPQNYRQKFIDSIINDNKATAYTEQDVIDTMFKDKNSTNPDDAFAHIKTIYSTKKNAFLFNKRLKGD